MTGRWDPKDEIDLDAVAATPAQGGPERVSVVDLAATDDLVERLARGLGAADEDPAARALAELVRVIDLDADRMAVDISALVDQVDWVPRREVETLPVSAPDAPPRPHGGSVRHLRGGTRTLRLAPLSGAAAAAVVAIAGTLFVAPDFFGNGTRTVASSEQATVMTKTVAGTVTFRREPVGREDATPENMRLWLDRAVRASQRKNLVEAARLVDMASRAIKFFPPEERDVYKAAVAAAAEKAGVLAPAVVVPPEAVRPAIPGVPGPSLFSQTTPAGLPSVIVTVPVDSPTFPADPPPVADPPPTTPPVETPPPDATQPPTEPTTPPSDPTTSPTDSPSTPPTTDTPTTPPSDPPPTDPPADPGNQGNGDASPPAEPAQTVPPTTVAPEGVPDASADAPAAP